MPTEWIVRVLEGAEQRMQAVLNELDREGFEIYTIVPAPEKMGSAQLVVVAKKYH